MTRHDECEAAFQVWHDGVYEEWFSDVKSDLYAAWVRLHEQGVKYSEISQAFDAVAEAIKRQYGE